jgi:single-stranded-DNA-specific exonuclease
MYAGLASAAPLLTRYGGHAAAAGLSLRVEQLDPLRDALNLAYRRQIGSQIPQRITTADATVTLDEIDERLAQEVALLEPFGIGNTEPLFLTRDAEVVRHKVVGSGHLQLTLRTGSTMRDGIGFGLGSRANDCAPGSRLVVAYVPEIDQHRGLRKVRLRLRDLVPQQAPATVSPTP